MTLRPKTHVYTVPDVRPPVTSAHGVPIAAVVVPWRGSRHMDVRPLPRQTRPNTSEERPAISGPVPVCPPAVLVPAYLAEKVAIERAVIRDSVSGHH